MSRATRSTTSPSPLTRVNNTYTITENSGNAANVIGTLGLGSGQVTRPDAYTVVVNAGAITIDSISWTRPGLSPGSKPGTR